MSGQLNDRANETAELPELAPAFPAALADDVRSAVAALPPSPLNHAGRYTVDVRGEELRIPERLYHPNPGPASGPAVWHQLTFTQRTLLHCLYTRNSDGWTRQHHLEQIVGSAEPWVVPYVVRLVGEYVVEILEAMRRGLLPRLDRPGGEHRLLYAEFVARNPTFYARTERRAVSYWSCHYRREYPHFADYPGAELLAAMRAAATEHTGRPWPDHTPRSRAHG